jgi:hypothetical protein
LADGIIDAERSVVPAMEREVRPEVVPRRDAAPFTGSSSHVTQSEKFQVNDKHGT